MDDSDSSLRLELLQHECPGCGRRFSQTNSFSLHQRGCKQSKARLSSALACAKENFARLKRARISGPSPPTSGPLAGPSGLLPTEPVPTKPGLSATPHDNLRALDSPGPPSPVDVSISPSTAVEAEEVDIFITLPSAFCESCLHLGSRRFEAHRTTQTSPRAKSSETVSRQPPRISVRSTSEIVYA